MTLGRIFALLAGAFVVMLLVVMLRTETTRENRKLAQLDREEQELLTRIQAVRVELARWRSPTLIQDELRKLRRAALGLPEGPTTRPAREGSKSSKKPRR